VKRLTQYLFESSEVESCVKQRCVSIRSELPLGAP
jgi:hypothetical protein